MFHHWDAVSQAVFTPSDWLPLPVIAAVLGQLSVSFGRNSA